MLTWLKYVACAAGAQLLIRLAMAFLRTLECRHPPAIDREGRHIPHVDIPCGFIFFVRDWLADFASTHRKEEQRDYWQPAVLGFLELLAYPLLLQTHHLNAIGAWLALKTAIEWGGWKEVRGAYNRFMIGNALVLGASFALWYLGVAPELMFPHGFESGGGLHHVFM